MSGAHSGAGRFHVCEKGNPQRRPATATRSLRSKKGSSRGVRVPTPVRSSTRRSGSSGSNYAAAPASGAFEWVKLRTRVPARAAARLASSTEQTSTRCPALTSAGRTRVWEREEVEACWLALTVTFRWHKKHFPAHRRNGACVFQSPRASPAQHRQQLAKSFRGSAPAPGPPH